MCGHAEILYIVCTEKVYEIDRTETGFWISSVSFITFHKAGDFLVMFLKKATLLKRV